MARLSKFCPTCQRKQPVELAMVPDAATSTVAWRVKCRACGTEIPSEFAGELVQDGKAWVAANRDRVAAVAATELSTKGDSHDVRRE